MGAPRLPFALLAALMFVELVSTDGCSRGPGSAPDAATKTAPAADLKSAATIPIDATAAARKYGSAPIPNEQVVYRPDVVAIEDGPKAIRGVSADGLTFRIDGNARGANQLAVGKIMLAASLAAGRIVELQRQDGDVLVRLAPAQFNEIVRKAVIDFDQELTPDAFARLASGGDAPLKVTIYRESTRETAVLPAVWHPSADGDGPFLRVSAGSSIANAGSPITTGPPTNSHSTVVPLGEGFAVEGYFNKTPLPAQSNPNGSSDLPPDLGAEMGVKLMKGIEYGGKDTSVKIGFDIRFTGHKIRLKEHLVFEDGSVAVSKSDLTIDGIEMMNVGFAAGSADGLKDNFKARLEFSPNEQVQVPGYPFVVTFGFKFFLDVVASSKDSTVWGKGAYEIKGPLGIGGGTAQTPTITVRTPISENLGGVTIGPMGFVIGFEPKVMLGLGIANVVNGGVYGKVRFSLGIARGSILGAPLVDCYGITWKIEEGLGVGMNYIFNVASLLGLKGKNNKGDIEISETMVPVWNPPTSGPSSKMCVGG